MAHELETYDNGEVGFIANRVPGWHNLGTVWQPGAEERLSMDTAIRTAHLGGWNVRLATTLIVLDPETGEAIPTEGWGITLRNNPTDPDAPAQPLGVVSEEYQPVQNEEAFAFGDALLGEGLEVETAGSIKGGRQVFMLFRIPEQIGSDLEVVYPYLHVTTSHDGSLAVTATLTGVRVVCANTQAMALAADTPRYAVRHFGEGMKGRLADAQEALGLAVAGIGTYREAMDLYLHTKVTPAQFDKVVLGRFPDPKHPEDEHPLAAANRAANRQTLRWLYEESDTNKAITGTAWGAVQSLIEYEDWYRGRSEGQKRSRWQVGATAMTARRNAFKITQKALRDTILLPV